MTCNNKESKRLFTFDEIKNEKQKNDVIKTSSRRTLVLKKTFKKLKKNVVKKLKKSFKRVRTKIN